jgi:glycosyltransferase involved in cell wall biosynthesis
MKILHISTSINGGAAVSAFRLHKALLLSGVDSMFMSRDCEYNQQFRTFPYYKKVEIKKNFQPELTIKNYFEEKLFRKFSKQNDLLIKENENKLDLISPNVFGKFEIFTSPYTLYNLIDSELYDSADIIHFHWVSNYLDYTSFFKQNKKPIVWTFHDLNPVLGGYHYQIDLIRNPFNQTIDIVYKELKNKILAELNELTIVAPSVWLKDKIISLNVFNRNTKILQCRYHIDTSIYKVLDMTYCRQIFNLEPNKFVFMFVAEDINNYRKGFDLLASIIIDSKFKDVNFLIVGESKDSTLLLSDNVIYTGKIKDERLMTVAYNCANYFILPSREDNLPNTMLESLVCGTPVISFDISDSKDILEKNNIGLVCPEISSDSLKESMIKCLNNDYIFDKNIISEVASFLFNESTVIDFYKKLYTNILNDKHNYN